MRMSERAIHSFQEKTKFGLMTECWPFSSLGIDGYGKMKDCNKTVRAHRFSYEFYNGREIPKGLIVRHSCDNPACVNPSHLVLGTVRDNTADAFSRGRRSGRKGLKSNFAKYPDEIIRDVLVIAKTGLSQAKIARLFGMSQPYVCNLLTKKRRCDHAL